MDFLEELRKNAIFFKVASTKFDGGVDINELLKVFKAISESYNSFIEVEFSRIAEIKKGNDYKKKKEDIIEDNSLIIVDLKFESLGLSLSPNTVTVNRPVAELKGQLNWKSEKFSYYSNNLLVSNFNDIDFINEVTTNYSYQEREKILKPIIDNVINNKNATTYFSLPSENQNKKFAKLKEINKKVLLAPTKKELEESFENKTVEIDNSYQTFALVELNSNKNKKAKILNLFTEIEHPIFKFTELVYMETSYKFKTPIYCELIVDDGVNYLENEALQIIGSGENLEEAKLSFSESFDHIYNRYLEMDDKELNDEVIEIKRFLKFNVSI